MAKPGMWPHQCDPALGHSLTSARTVAEWDFSRAPMRDRRIGTAHSRHGGLLTLFANIPLGLAVGASLAWVGRHLGRNGQSLLRHPAVLSAMLIGLGLFAPLTSFAIFRYPDWYFMYFFTGESVATLARLALVLLQPMTVVAGAVLALYLIDRKQRVLAKTLIGGSLVGIAAVLVFAHKRLMCVGSFMAYHDQARSLMPGLHQSRLGFAMMIGALAILGVWFYTLAFLRRQNTLIPYG